MIEEQPHFVFYSVKDNLLEKNKKIVKKKVKYKEWISLLKIIDETSRGERDVWDLFDNIWFK